ncbi:glycosyltransferase [Hydrogenophaga sp.]|uniref:glycosyltransferase n=1 Tax=Hydrogenophaga sp. TaxID=1904254 RepID=UPI00272F613A|nr:glycosyltransferase [Hydrogenophaga sp.]MDP1684470.1 glycosyltransferase [Hydrogenophaga sp.]
MSLHQLLRSSPSIDVFVFHSIDTVVPFEKAWFTSIEQFNKTLDFIEKNYRVLTMSEAIEALDKGGLPQRTACLTFDDGDPTWLTNVAPELQRRNFPATFYVSTGALAGEPIWHDRLADVFARLSAPEFSWPALGIRSLKMETAEQRIRAMEQITRLIKYQFAQVRNTMLTELELACGIDRSGRRSDFNAQMVRDLSAMGHEIGSHTVTHPILTFCSAGDALNEITQSREELAEIIRAPVRSFSYPNGKPGLDFDLDHAAMVKGAGYTSAVTTAHGRMSKGGSTFLIPRFTPWGSTPLSMRLQILQNRLSRPKPMFDPAVQKPMRVMVVENGTGFGGAVVALKSELGGLDARAVSIKIVSPNDYGLKALPVVQSLQRASTRRRRSGVVGMDSIIKKAFRPSALQNWLVSRNDDIFNRAPYFAALLWGALWFRPHLIHGNNELSANREALLVAKILGLPYVQHIRGPIGPSAGNAYLKNWPSTYVAVSRWLYFELGKLGIAASRLQQMYDPIESTSSCEHERREICLPERLGLPRNALLVAMVGMLLPWKGQHLFLNAIEKLGRDLPNVHFLVVGETPEYADAAYEAGLRESVRDRKLSDIVSFTSNIPDLHRHMHSFQVTVSASLDPEPLGLVMLEALAAGSYFVGPAHGATAEVVGDQHHIGRLFTPGSVESLVEALRDALEHVHQHASDGHRRPSGLSGDARFSKVNATQMLMTIYRSVLS